MTSRLDPAAARRLLRHTLGGVRRDVALCARSGLAWQAVAVAVPWVLERAVDIGVLAGDRAALWWWSAALVALGALRWVGDAARHWWVERAGAHAVEAGDGGRLGTSVLAYLALTLVLVVVQQARRRLGARAGEAFLADLRDAVATSLLARPLAFFDRHPAGELVARSTTDVQALSGFVRRVCPAWSTPGCSWWSPPQCSSRHERSAAVQRHLRRVRDRLPDNPERLRPMSDDTDAVVLHLRGADAVVRGGSLAVGASARPWTVVGGRQA